MSRENRFWTVLGIFIAAISAMIAYIQLKSMPFASVSPMANDLSNNSSNDDLYWTTRGTPIKVNFVDGGRHGVVLRIKNNNSFPVQAIHKIKCRIDSKKFKVWELIPADGTTDWIKSNSVTTSKMNFIMNDNTSKINPDDFINCYIYTEVHTPDGIDGIRTPMDNCLNGVCGVGDDDGLDSSDYVNTTANLD